MSRKNRQPKTSDLEEFWQPGNDICWDAFLYEYWELPYEREKWPEGKPSIQAAFSILNAPTILAIRTEQHKLVTYRGKPDQTELFDLIVDPYETQNQANKENYAGLLVVYVIVSKCLPGITTTLISPYWAVEVRFGV